MNLFDATPCPSCRSASCADFCPALQKRVQRAVSSFPAKFGLRGFPGEVFRVSERASYGSGGSPMLYTERRTETGEWVDFAKGREGELRAQIVTVTS